MARTFVRASSQALELTSVPAGVTKESGPLTMMAWYKPSSIANGTVFGIGNSTEGSKYLALGMEPSGKAFFEEGSGNDSLSTGTLTNGTWAHIAGVVTSATKRQVFLNGTAGAASTPSATQTINRTDVGGLSLAGSLVSFAGGDIGEVALWKVALTEAQIKELAAGKNPHNVEPANLIGYWQILGEASPEPSYKGEFGGSLVLVGTPAKATGGNPPVESPEGGSTSQGKAAGTATGAGTAKGTALPNPTKQGKAAGTAIGAGTAKGQVVHEGKAAGSAAGSGTAKGSAIAAGVSQGKASGTATGSGTAKGSAIAPSVAQGKAAGTATGAGTAKGVVVHEGKASGSATGSGSAKGIAISTGTAQGRAVGTAVGSGTAAARVIHRGTAAGTAHGGGTARAVEPEHKVVLRVSYPAYFPTGTTVELYVDPHIGDLLDLGYETVPVTRFLGDVVATQVMPSSEEIEFTGTGIEEEEDYLAYANVGGDQRLVRLRLSPQR